MLYPSSQSEYGAASCSACYEGHRFHTRPRSGRQALSLTPNPNGIYRIYRSVSKGGAR